jgi:hypothetical protein
MPTDPRYFLCTGECVKYEDLHLYPHSHIIGELRYVTYEGHKVTALLVYKKSLSVINVSPVRQNVLCRQLGDVRDFECLYPDCENRWDWHISDKTAEVLLSGLYTPVKRRKVAI